MCDPVSLGLGNLALGVASAGGGFLSGLFGGAQNRAAARQNLDMNVAQTALRMQQEREASATKIFQMAREADGAEAAARLRASEMGVSGNTVMSLIGDLQGQEALREHIVQKNSDNVIQQLAMGAMGAGARAEQQIANGPQASLGSLALGVAKAGLSGYNAYNAASDSTGVKNKTNALLALLKRNKDTEDD